MDGEPEFVLCKASDILDRLIVGVGPAGLAAAAIAIHHGLSRNSHE